MAKTGFLDVTGRDIPAEYLEQCIEAVFESYLADIAKRADLSVSDSKWLAIESEAFRANFAALKQSRNGAAKEAGLRTILSALNFSVYHRGGSNVIEKFRRGVKKDHIKSAIEANTHTEIDAIVAEEVANHRAISNGNRTSQRGIASLIVGKVVKRVNQLPHPPKDWRFCEPLSDKEEAMVADRIRSIMRRKGI